MKRLFAIVLPVLMLGFSTNTVARTYCVMEFGTPYYTEGDSCDSSRGGTQITKEKYDKLLSDFRKGIRTPQKKYSHFFSISTKDLTSPIFFAVFFLLNIHWWVFVILHVWFLRKESKDMPFLGRVAIVSFITVCAAYLFERYVIKDVFLWVPSILAIAVMAIVVNGIWDAIRKHRPNPNETGAIKSVADRIKPVLNPTDSKLSENDRKLRQLKKLVDDGVITEEDYAKKKKELLDKF